MKKMCFKWLVSLNAVIALTVILSANVWAAPTDVNDNLTLMAALGDPNVTDINLIANIEVVGGIPITISSNKNISSTGGFDLTLGGQLTIESGVTLSMNLQDFIVDYPPVSGNPSLSELIVRGNLYNTGTITAKTPFNLSGGGYFENQGTINMNDTFNISSTITNAANGIININNNIGSNREISAPIANAGRVYAITNDTISTGSGGASSYVNNTAGGFNFTIINGSSTTVSTLEELEAAMEYAQGSLSPLTNIIINSNIALTQDITIDKNLNITVDTGVTLTVPAPHSIIIVNTTDITEINRLSNNGTIVGNINNLVTDTGRGGINNDGLIIGTVTGILPSEYDPGIIITNGHVDAYNSNQIKLALATSIVKTIEQNFYYHVSLYTTYDREDVTITIPNKAGSGSSTFYISVYSDDGVFVNRGTLIVASENGLDIDSPTVISPGIVYNSGTITTTGVGTIRGGTVYSGNTVNPTFDVSTIGGPIEFREYNGETYFAIGADNKLFTRYTGSATLTGAANVADTIVNITSGTHNINFSNLTMTTTAATPFVVGGTANINLIGLNTVSGLESGMSTNPVSSNVQLNITSSTGGKLISNGTGIHSNGITAERILINGNADVTANGEGDGAGIQSSSITIGGTALVTATHTPIAGSGMSAIAFSTKPILSLATGYTATVRAGAAAPGVLIANHTTTDYNLNMFAQVQITQTPTTTTTYDPALSPQTGVYN